MKQCFSGGFIDDLSGHNRVIVTSCTPDQESKRAEPEDEGHYGEFTYHFQSALNGQTPTHEVVDADTNGNGYISIFEAYQYAKEQDSQPETPQLDDDGNGLSEYTGDNDDGSFAKVVYI